MKQNTKKRKSLRQWLNTETVSGYIFILPFIIGFIVFSAIPIVVSLILSFSRYDILSPPQFIGLDNYVRMFTQDAKFWKTMGVTFYYSLVSVPLRLIMALLVAMILNRPSKATSVYRAVYYLPSIMGGSVAVAVLWRYIFSVDGLVNQIMMKFGLQEPIAWLGRTDTAIWTLIILAIWQFGSAMLVFLAGLKQIPVSLYEAAVVDGCGKVQQFFRITLPMLTPVIFFNLVMQLINSFMAFTQSFIVTQGKPLDSTLFYAVYMYQRSFEFYEMGYGSAMAWIMLLVVAIMSGFIFKSSNYWVFYEEKGE